MAKSVDAPFRVAVVGGKGGTGKTLIATCLAQSLGRWGTRATYVDADVESPTGHLALRPRTLETKPVHARTATIDSTRCNNCGRCLRVCEFGAIIEFGATPQIVTERCRGCGACILVCPNQAVADEARVIGEVRVCEADGVAFVDGALVPGEQRGDLVVEAVKRACHFTDYEVIDCPSGTSRCTISALEGCDLALVVAEPTLFGIRETAQCAQLCQHLAVPARVVLNRAGLTGDAEREASMFPSDLSIWAEVPFAPAISAATASGQDPEERCFSLREAISRLTSLIHNFDRQVRSSDAEQATSIGGL